MRLLIIIIICDKNGYSFKDKSHFLNNSLNEHFCKTEVCYVEVWQYIVFDSGIYYFWNHFNTNESNGSHTLEYFQLGQLSSTEIKDASTLKCDFSAECCMNF